jgi:outer membrane protein assembly factor BamA
MVPEGKYLLHNTAVRIQGKPQGLNRSDLTALISQKPNRHFLGTRPQLWVYYQTINRTDSRFWRWINEQIGRPPVYLDELATKNSAEQMSRYLANVGFFYAHVDFDISLSRNQAAVGFQVDPSWAYRINSVNFSITDTALASSIDLISQQSLVKAGSVFNVYTLDNERDRITEYLRNQGYYFFGRDFILFEADTNLRNQAVDITLRINSMSSDKHSADNLNRTVPHRRYIIRKVNLFPATQPLSMAKSGVQDTVVLNFRANKKGEPHTMSLFFNGNPRIRPAIFTQLVQLKNNDLYSINKVRQTYRGLANLRIYQGTRISFDTVPDEIPDSDPDARWIDCNISMQRTQSMAYGFDVEGTNSGGDLGLRGSLHFTHKNLFNGAEVFRFRINGGIEAQELAAGISGSDEDKIINIFNTTELGADVNLSIPRFLSPVRLRKFRQEYQPKTNLNFGYSAQNRVNYSRTLTRAAFGYDWMASNTISHILTPVNLNSVKVTPSPEFQKILDNETNQRIREQYSNHLILGMKYSFIFNNQNINKANDFFYFRLNLETSGNLVSLFNKTSLVSNKGDYSEFFGIRYAQFVRSDLDFRYYRLLGKYNRLVFRTIMGVGLPHGNSRDMPFERSFYAGGSNGMRGWSFRELGPGTYQGDTDNIEKIGDVQLEASVEYRFPVYSFLNGAFFADLGNIWTLRDVDYLPGGEFRFDRFYKQLGFDAGVGFRFDFSFFIFRIDAAVPLHDPSKPENDRWVLDKLQLRDSNWQIGIGYPF